MTLEIVGATASCLHLRTTEPSLLQSVAAGQTPLPQPGNWPWRAPYLVTSPLCPRLQIPGPSRAGFPSSYAPK